MRANPVADFLRCLAVAVLFGCLLPHGASAQQGDLHEQADEVLSQGDIQRDAPLAERARSQAQDVAQDPSLQHQPPRPSADIPDPPRLPIPGTLFLYLLIGTLAVCACLVLYHLLRTYAPGRRAWSKAGQVVTVAAEAIPPAAGEAPLPPLDEIERLARAGAYAEAIHLMLLRALEALRQRLGASWAKSLTSREIVRRSELPGTDRQALKVLVGAVEICRFGGQQANEQVYRACLDHYRSIGGDSRMAPA